MGFFFQPSISGFICRSGLFWLRFTLLYMSQVLPFIVVGAEHTFVFLHSICFSVLILPKKLVEKVYELMYATPFDSIRQINVLM